MSLRGNDDDEPGVRRTDPDTSRSAISRKGVGKLHEEFLKMLLMDSIGAGLSTTEIARFKGANRDSYSPRACQLVRKGLIEMIGKRSVPNFSGRMQMMRIYILKAAGRELAQQLAEDERRRNKN